MNWRGAQEFSAASGRGLIEAPLSGLIVHSTPAFSAASGRGLIEAVHRVYGKMAIGHVFRGIGPRPH